MQEIPVKMELRRHSAVHYKDKILIFGGEDEVYNENNTVYILDLSTGAYSPAKVCGTPPRPMKDHTATIVVEIGFMLVFGGSPNAKGAVHALELSGM